MWCFPTNVTSWSSGLFSYQIKQRHPWANPGWTESFSRVSMIFLPTLVRHIFSFCSRLLFYELTCIILIENGVCVAVLGCHHAVILQIDTTMPSASRWGRNLPLLNLARNYFSNQIVISFWRHMLPLHLPIGETPAEYTIWAWQYLIPNCKQRTGDKKSRFYSWPARIVSINPCDFRYSCCSAADMAGPRLTLNTHEYSEDLTMHSFSS